MKAAEYQRMRLVEDEHWWYAVLHQMVLRALKLNTPDAGRVLDAGCGTGGMLKLLASWEASGVDASPLAIEMCRARGLSGVTVARVEELACEDETFDAVLSLDVLYHAEVNSDAAMRQMIRVLKPGGILILNLPAFECLRGAHDLAVCGVRRYRACHVRELARFHKLDVMKLHYWNAWLWLPLVGWRWISRWLPVHSSDVKLPPRWMNKLMSKVAMIDAYLCECLRLPFGSSVFAVLRKPLCELTDLSP